MIFSAHGGAIANNLPGIIDVHGVGDLETVQAISQTVQKVLLARNPEALSADNLAAVIDGVLRVSDAVGQQVHLSVMINEGLRAEVYQAPSHQDTTLIDAGESGILQRGAQGRRQ